MMLRATIIWLIASAIAFAASNHILTIKQAEQLALNTPDVLSLTPVGRKRCPEAESSTVSETIVWIQIRNRCPISGSGLMANYTVDLSTGTVFGDAERTKPIRSRRLELLRRQMFRPLNAQEKSK